MHRTREWFRSMLVVTALVSMSSIAALPSAASVTPKALSAGDHSFTLSVQGTRRSYILHVPTGRAVAKRPLILVFHGSNATASGTIGVTDFEQEANRTGEVVAFLQGVDNHWNEYSGTFGSSGINDVMYTRAVISDIERRIGFDHARIVASGFSNGALMAQSLGCQLSRTLAMIVPVEGQLTTSMVKSCKPAQAISVYEIHGTADALIPYSGGGHLSVLSAPASAARWAKLDHCGATPKTTRPKSDEMVSAYGACRLAAKVSLLTIYGGVHRWTPGIGEIVTAAFPWKR